MALPILGFLGFKKYMDDQNKNQKIGGGSNKDKLIGGRRRKRSYFRLSSIKKRKYKRSKHSYRKRSKRH